ncbi:lipocalin-like domain-containing protein [Subtercola lobariae]|uniref:Lipocalin-like domain-containing protein n=1 Tax=Subtercola lobariae TaxID=1588641 RepID=A0A917B175_9MICO|nr:lipocalin-like domain-containing protein [Subtercola lobariae]GGF16596.1 hypothetical protein GCM10011399_07970 [Subtercola lobariae]
MTSVALATTSTLLGSWMLRSYVETADTGETRLPLGEHPQGSILYTGDGRMSAQILRSTDEAGASDKGPGTDRADAYFLAYSARFWVDEAAQIVTHEIEISAIPSWNDTSQRRRIGLLADGSLTLTTVEPVATTSGTSLATLTWVRYPA